MRSIRGFGHLVLALVVLVLSLVFMPSNRLYAADFAIASISTVPSRLTSNIGVNVIRTPDRYGNGWHERLCFQAT